MSMTDEQFDEYLDYCYDNLETKQENLLEKYGIGNGIFEEYHISQETAILQFKNNGEVLLEFNVVYIGSWSKKSNTWLWAWANESILEKERIKASRLLGLKDITGFDIFGQSGFECDEAMAHELTAFAVEHLNAMGMYICPNKDRGNYMFVAIMSQKI